MYFLTELSPIHTNIVGRLDYIEKQLFRNSVLRGEGFQITRPFMVVEVDATKNTLKWD